MHVAFRMAGGRDTLLLLLGVSDREHVIGGACADHVNIAVRYIRGSGE